MDFYHSQLKLWLLLAITATILPAKAQQGGQSIIFSSPRNDDVTSNGTALTPAGAGQLNLRNEFEAPKSFFQIPNTSRALPLPQPQIISPAGQQRMKKLLEDRKNWTLLTPEEILGMTAPEKTMDSPDDADTAFKKEQTPMERYLDRQDRLRLGNTNTFRSGNLEPWIFSREQDKAHPSILDADGLKNQLQNSERLRNGMSDHSDFFMNQSAGSGWSLTGPPQSQPQTAAPNAEQLAAMGRFRELLDASSATEDATPSPNNKFFPVPKSASDPNMTTPDFVVNPVGASFTPLSSGVSRPLGLTPLPGIVAPVNLHPAAPSWAPKPAPWLSQVQDGFTVPQRKF